MVAGSGIWAHWDIFFDEPLGHILSYILWPTLILICIISCRLYVGNFQLDPNICSLYMIVYVCVLYVCIYVREWACVYAHRLADKHILNLPNGYSGCQTTRDFGLLVIIRLIKYSCFLFFFGDILWFFKGKRYLHSLMCTPCVQ